MNNKRLRAIGVSIFTAAILVAGAAQAQPKTLAELVAAAEQEGELTFYTTTADDFVQKLTGGFNAEYPNIQVKVLRLSSGALHARFATETETGVYIADMVDTTSDELHTAHPEWFIELSDANVPELATWPADVRRDRYVMSAMIPHVLVYNTNMVKTPIEKWPDLLTGEYNGKCVQLDPRAAPVYMSFFSMMKQYYGDAFLNGVRDMDCKLASSGVPAAQEVAAGSAVIAFPVPLSQATGLIDKGAPIAVLEPTADGTPTHLAQRYFSVPAKAPHPNAGLLFLLWNLTPAAQELACSGVYSSPLADIPNCRPLPAASQAARYDFTPEQQAEVISALGLQ